MKKLHLLLLLLIGSIAVKAESFHWGCFQGYTYYYVMNASGFVSGGAELTGCSPNIQKVIFFMGDITKHSYDPSGNPSDQATETYLNNNFFPERMSTTISSDLQPIIDYNSNQPTPPRTIIDFNNLRPDIINYFNSL